MSRLKPDFVLLDIELPMFDLLFETGRMTPAPVSVVMTGHGTEWAERALDKGAADFLAKPFDSIRLRVTAMRRKELNDQIDSLSQKRGQLGGLIGSSPPMRAV